MKKIAIVLAAGQGTRMKSKQYKVLHSVCGKPMIGHIVDLLEQIAIEQKIMIVGHGAAAVENYLADRVVYVHQEEQLGTGHAVQQATSLLGSTKGTTLVICGDTPLVRPETLDQLFHYHQQQKAAATILTATLLNPQGYGRIIREHMGSVLQVVEQKDCTPLQSEIQEINTGIYCFDNQLLFEALKQIKNHNLQGEYYLPDVLPILHDMQKKICALKLEDATEAIGINDRIALAEAESIMRQRINRNHMKQGVTLIDPSTTYIEAEVEIGQDTVIYPNSFLRGRTKIDHDCEIGPNTEIKDSEVSAGSEIKQSILQNAKVGKDAKIGPFSHIRPDTLLGEKVRIGNFVELKNAKIGNCSKISHLSYVGDAIIGKSVNFGCGAITVNYDGFNKEVTVIQDGAFVGSNTNLIAPVKVGKDAYVVAGSTITNDVDENEMAIARQRQTNKPGYAEKIRSRAILKKQDLSEKKV